MRRGFALTLAVTALLIVPSAAQADFHLMKISEVFPGTPAAPDKAFIELRMVASGQNLVGGHAVTVYDAAATPVLTVPMTSDVANAQNNRTVLLGDIDVGNRDFNANLGVTMAASGGAVCFADASPPDCVAWGNFAGALPGVVGTPVAPGGIPGVMTAGSSITRDISAGCPTFLEAVDDTGDSLADFDVTETETPEANHDPVSTTDCGGGGGGAGGSGGNPNTKITKAPKRKTAKVKARFKFRSTKQGSSFECELDKGKFRSCRSPRTYKRLDTGKHRFRVRAIDADGNADPKPAKHRWRVVR
jgi:hypothetical protein